MSDYISKSALIDVIVNTPSIVSRCSSYLYRNGYMNGKVERQHEIVDIIETQPTLDEKEIIRKAFERVMEKLEKERIDCLERIANKQLSEDMLIHNCYKKAIEIVKEVGGIE